MKTKNSFSLLPVVLIFTALTAGAGRFIENIYARELPYMSIKCQTHDVVLLLVAIPIGITLYSLIRKNSFWAKVFALGLLVYLLFFIGFNVFNLQFNRLFLLYILVICLSSIILIKGSSELLQSAGKLGKLPHRRLLSIIILFIAVSGFGFWLSEVVPATISDSIPHSIKESNLPVNAACVFDLAFMLPLMVIGAVKLWKEETLGLVISVIMLSWLVLTSISVVSMEFGLKHAGLDFDLVQIISVGFNGTLGALLIWLIVRKAEITQPDKKPA